MKDKIIKKIFIITAVGIVALIGLYFANIIYQKLSSKEIMLNQNKEEKVVSGDLQKMVFAGGCFWCTEASYNPEYGVDSAISGYMGGTVINPNYEQVSDGDTGAREAVLVYFNPASTSIKKLLINYWTHIDPTQGNGQFRDIGYQYTAAIYYFTEEQKALAEESKKILEESKKFINKKIVVEIIDGRNIPFYPAEEYHQDYSDKNPVRYEYYKNGSGRSDFIKNYWHEDKTFENFLSTDKNEINIYKNFTKDKKEIKLKELTALQYKVTQEEGTEKPFENIYDKNYGKGIYTDIVSGEPLYLSSDKFDSGTGWPSFVKPISEDMLTLKTDNYLFYSRTEVRSKIANSHLGHVFDDGPLERGGKRYCMNSAALRFIPLSEMQNEGYGEYINLIK